MSPVVGATGTGSRVNVTRVELSDSTTTVRFSSVMYSALVAFIP